MSLDGVELLPKASGKHLGVELDDNLEWKKHVMNLKAKCLLAPSRISRDLPQEAHKRLYCALVQPHVDYCCVVWDHCSKHLQTKVETIQNRGMRYILNSPWSTTGTELGWTTLSQRRNLLTLKTIHKCIHKRAPPTFMKNLSSSVTWATLEPEEPPNFIYIGQEWTFIKTLLNTQVLSYGTHCLIQ